MSRQMSAKQIITFGLVILALGLALHSPGFLTQIQASTLGVVLLTLVLWGAGDMPNYVPALIFFAGMLIFKLAPTELVFSGFGSAAVWLVISGFVIGSAIKLSGLGDRLAEVVSPVLSSSYPRLIGGLMLLSMLLGFLMPSSIGRSVALVPIGMALAERCGFQRGSNGRIGIAVTLAIGCNMPSFAILPSNIPNMILTGSAETIYGSHFSYLEYLLLHYPVLGILKSLIAVILVLTIFPATATPARTAPDVEMAVARGNPAREAYVAFIMLSTLMLWATDNIHGINPAWVGLGTAIVFLLPGIGVVSSSEFKSSADFGTILFVAGALALGAVVNESGLGTIAGYFLQKVLPLHPGQGFLNFVSLTLMSFMTGLFTTIPGVPTVLTPIAQDLADLSGLDLKAVLMTQVVGFSTVLLPYQVAPLVVAMQLSGEKLGHLVKVCVPLSIITLVALVPVDYAWWSLLGKI